MNAVHATLRFVGAPFRLAALGLIAGYRKVLSPAIGPRCKYYPSCSAYAEEAIRVHGFVKGLFLGTWRLLRCNPLSSGGIDRVPPRDGVPLYEYVIHRRSHAEVTS